MISTRNTRTTPHHESRQSKRSPVRAVVAAGVAMVASLLIAPVPSTAAADPPPVVPRVHSWATASDTVTLTASSRIVVDSATAGAVAVAGVSSPLVVDRTLQEVAGSIAADVQTELGFTPDVVVGGTPTSGDVAVSLEADAALAETGYAVDLTGGVARITAQSSTGAYYASRTVLQGMRASATDDTLTHGVDSDVPTLSHRAVSIDVGRRYWEIDELEKLIEQMAWHKLNVLHLHFNESEAFRLYSPDYAGLAPTDPSYRYDEAQIAALEEFANDHHVTLVPEIDVPAHSTAIALGGGTDRSLAPHCGSQYEWVLDYIDADIRAWNDGMISEFMSWFDGPYFHIGNDEVPHDLANCTYVQDAIDADPAISTFENLQERFANELNATVKATGKRTLMWANASNILPDTDIVLVNFGSDANADNLRSLGYDVINTAYDTGSYTRFFVIPAAFGDSRHVAKGNIYNWTPTTLDDSNVGQQLAVWADEEFFGETRYFTDEIDPRRAELAERTWNSSATTASLSQFYATVEAVGDAPGVDTSAPPRTADGLPDHYYDFEGQHQVTSDTHFVPAYAHPTVTDHAGGLHGNAYSQRAPQLGVAGFDGEGAGFAAESNRRFSVGGADVAPPWTVATWIRLDTAGDDTQLMRSWTGAIKTEQYQTQRKVGITTYGVEDYSFGYSLPVGDWVHLALTATPSGTTLYIDGQAVETIPDTIALPRGSIGGNRAFGGALDELKIYDEALDATQVAALYDAYGAGATDIAQGKPASASSVETAGFEPELAFDGDGSTRWSSERTDPQWIAVDLGTTSDIDEVHLDWEAAYASAYEVQVSDDGQSWTTVASVSNGDGGVDVFDNLAAAGRYVRMYGTARGTQWGYSLWSFNVYGA